MPAKKQHEWLTIKPNGHKTNVNCDRKLMTVREAEIKKQKTKSKLDIIELLTIRFLAFNNISEELTYIL